MPEIGTFGLMSGDGKRGVGHRPQATAPILDSTIAEVVGSKGERHKPSYRSLTPLNARRLSALN